MEKKVAKKAKAEVEYDGKTPLADAKQELFCVLYTSHMTPRYFGHGQHSYAFAYGYQKKIDEIQEVLPLKSHNTGRGRKKKASQYSLAEVDIKKMENVCRSAGARLLLNVNIRARCNHLMDQLASHLIVDRELLYVINQRHDLPSKVQAIRHHDQREARVREKVDIKHEFEPIKGFTYVTPEPATPVKKK